MKNCGILLLVLFFKSTLFAQIPAGEAWYPFCNNGTDRSGKNRHATVTSCYPTTNRFGQVYNAYNFPGNGYIDIPSSTIMGLSTYCYSMWILISSNSPSTQCIFSGGGNDIYGQHLYILPSGHLMAVSHNSGGSPSSSSVSSPSLTPDKWHHVVVLRNSTLMRMYFDNVLINGTYHNGTSARWGSTSPYNIFLGLRTNGLDYFIGKIDDVRLYAGNLSSTQVAALYQETLFPKVIPYGDTICVGESAMISASGATSYTLPGAPAGIVNPVNTGTYAVVGASLGCVTTATVQVMVDACTGLSSASKENELKIYPNPGNGTFMLSLTSQANKIIRYTVEDLSGRNVMQGETFGKDLLEIKMEALPGTYILRLYTDEGGITNKKLIIRE